MPGDGVTAGCYPWADGKLSSCLFFPAARMEAVVSNTGFKGEIASETLRGTRTARVERYIRMEQGAFGRKRSSFSVLSFQTSETRRQMVASSPASVGGKGKCLLAFFNLPSLLCVCVCGRYVALRSWRDRGGPPPQCDTPTLGTAELLLHSKCYKQKAGGLAKASSTFGKVGFMEDLI